MGQRHHPDDHGVPCTQDPPESIQANIATFCSIISPNYNILKQMPSSTFIRANRSALAVETLTMGAYQIAKATRIVAHHSDATSRRGISIDNNVLRTAQESGYKNVCLSSFVICKNQTSEQVCSTLALRRVSFVFK